MHRQNINESRVKKYAESRLGGPQFKMTEILKVKVPRARNHLLKFITDALRRKKITVSSSFAKCSLVLFKAPHPLYSLKELPRNFELLPSQKTTARHRQASKLYLRFLLLMQIFASDLIGSTTKIAFLKISPDPTAMEIIYGTFDKTLRPTCLADTSATE